VTYIFGILIIGLFFLALHYFTDLNNSQKWWVTTIVLAVLSIMVMFNEYQNQESERIRAIATAFNQGKSIQCNDKNVSNASYTLSVGTYTFIGKENTPHAGEMISASDCE